MLYILKKLSLVKGGLPLYSFVGGRLILFIKFTPTTRALGKYESLKLYSVRLPAEDNIFSGLGNPIGVSPTAECQAFGSFIANDSCYASW